MPEVEMYTSEQIVLASVLTVTCAFPPGVVVDTDTNSRSVFVCASVGVAVARAVELAGGREGERDGVAVRFRTGVGVLFPGVPAARVAVRPVVLEEAGASKRVGLAVGERLGDTDARGVSDGRRV